MMGQNVKSLFDVGVAGIHRLLSHFDEIQKASVIIVLAGMDGALPSVVGGLVKVPIIAVPTSTGYGANFSGLAPLLTMLNSCAAGVTVVNINNGFGAGYAASIILKIWKINKMIKDISKIKYYENILGTIGNTPLVKINRINAGLKPKIFAKIEFLIPAEV